MKLKQKFLRLIGHKYDTRYTWGELSFRKKFNDIGLIYYPPGYFERKMLSIKGGFFSVFIKLSTKNVGDGCLLGKEPAYGFYTIDNSIVWRWGDLYKSWDFPFVSLNWESTEILNFDKKSVWIETEESRKEARDDGIWQDCWKIEQEVKKAHSKTYNYTYKLKSGKTQKRKATVHITRRTWKRKWLPFSKFIRTEIDINFNDGVGERAGSWKGGCTGCSWELKDNETPEQALRRMENERKFT